MADRAIIRISAVPDSDLRRALTGTVDASRKASRQVASEEQRALRAAERASEWAAREKIKDAKWAAREQAREAKKAADAQAREAKRGADLLARETKRAAAVEAREAKLAADAEIREAERAAKAKQREIAQTLRVAERSARATAREAAKSARAQIREAEKAGREQQKIAQETGEKRRAMLLGLGAGAYGAFKGAAALAGRGQGLAGVGSLEERLGTAGDFKAQLIRTAGEAKVSPEERAKIEANLLKISDDTNVSLMDLVGGLTAAQQRFDKFREFSATIGDIAKVSQATGENLEDLVGAIGTATTVFQLDEAGQRDFINALIATSERGSIGVGNVARDLAATMGSFQIATKRTGPEAAREFLAASQVFGTSQAGAAETATMIDRFMQEISLPETQAKLRRIGLNVTDKNGQLKNVGEIGTLLAGSKRFQQAGVRQAIFPEIRAKRGAEFLIAELARDPQAFSALQNASGVEGATSVDRRRTELAADPIFRLRNLGIRAQTETVRDADRIVTAITPAVTELTKLQLQFPLLTESVDTLEQTVRWAVGTLLAERFIRGGAAVAAAGGLGNAAAGAALGNAAAGSFVGKLGAAGSVIGAGLASYLATTGFLKMTGLDKSIETLGVRLHDQIYGGPTKTKRGFVAPAETYEQERKRLADADIVNLPAGGYVAPFSMVPEEKPAPRPFSMLPGTAFTDSTTIPSPLIPAMGAEAKLVIEVIGPGRVKSVTSTNTDIDVSNRGNRNATPP